ncbi:HAMP domain-containing sensor histidine kinase [Pelagibius sp. CAU 1746]|uniref:sensor histidine kinase n=1 Tax=Pelagibius sp. CAU 1746 TaxID=3140370 RepID=UPI00325B6D88
MDPSELIKLLNLAMFLVIGCALLVFWRISKGRAFLLHWSVYEFSLAASIFFSNNLLASSIAVALGVPILLAGVLGYRRQRQPPPYVFALLALAIVLPINIIAAVFGTRYGVFYLTSSIALGHVAATVLFIIEGRALNYFIAATFAYRSVNAFTFSMWIGTAFAPYGLAANQLVVLCGGIAMLIAGFAKTYRELKDREQELAEAYRRTESLMQDLEWRNTEYAQARREAEAANAAKSQFLANMSHELRTPLNAVLGFSEMLIVLPRERALKEMTRYAGHIHEAASGLRLIIDDILDISRVEAGALQLKDEACDLGQILNDCLRLIGPLANDKEITVSGLSGPPCPVRCDYRLTKQALINGLSNAVKFTQRRGEITCRVERDGEMAVVTVEDNGIGIDDKGIAKAFDPFWQEGNNFLAENKGVGLGLTIARSYVAAQGGAVEVARAGERGTIFRLSLPLAGSRSQDMRGAAGT